MLDTKRLSKNQREARHPLDIKDVGDNLEEEETEGVSTKDVVGYVPLERQHFEKAKGDEKDCRRMKHIRRPVGPSSFQSNNNMSKKDKRHVTTVFVQHPHEGCVVHNSVFFFENISGAIPVSPQNTTQISGVSASRVSKRTTSASVQLTPRRIVRDARNRRFQPLHVERTA